MRLLEQPVANQLDHHISLNLLVRLLLLCLFHVLLSEHGKLILGRQHRFTLLSLKVCGLLLAGDHFDLGLLLIALRHHRCLISSQFVVERYLSSFTAAVINRCAT